MCIIWSPLVFIYSTLEQFHNKDRKKPVTTLTALPFSRQVGFGKGLGSVEKHHFATSISDHHYLSA